MLNTKTNKVYACLFVCLLCVVITNQNYIKYIIVYKSTIVFEDLRQIEFMKHL